MYKPNLQLALASSYNERGVAGFTNTVTNRIDQQKVNCMYDLTKNAITGSGKVELTKRPGVTIDANSYGVSTQAAYLIQIPNIGQPQSLTSSPWVYSKDGLNIQVSNNSTTTTIFSSSAAEAYVPAFFCRTLISNVEADILQCRTATTPSVHRAFFSNGIATWAEIVDADFTGAVPHRGKIECMDGFAFILTGNNKLINSDLNSLANWPALGFITKQIQEDYPVGLARLNNQILAFGDETVEAFYNAGNATGSPLSPIKQLHQRIGLIDTPIPGGTHYYSTVDNRLYFVGRRAGGAASIGVFTYNGSSFEKVSTAYIDKILGEQSASIYSINSFGFHGKSAISIALTAPTATTQRWLIFFPDWKDWFEWNSTVFSPVNNGEFFLGITPNQHKVYKFSASDNWQDNGTNFTAFTQFKLPQDGHQRKRMAEFGVLADTARSTNMLSVEFSDDDYVSFINIGAIDLARDIKTLNRGGSYRQRAVRLSSTNALETRLSAFIARVE